MNIARSSW